MVSVGVAVEICPTATDDPIAVAIDEDEALP